MTETKKPRMRIKMSRSHNTSRNKRAVADQLNAQANIEKAKGESNMAQLIGMSLLLIAGAVVVSIIMSAMGG